MDFQALRPNINFGIKQKFIGTVTVLFLAAAISISLYLPNEEAKQAMVKLEEKGISIAQVLAFSLAPALSFEDQDAASRNIQAVKNLSDVKFALVYNARGELTTAYHQENSDGFSYGIKSLFKETQTGVIGKSGMLIVHIPITAVQNEQVGRLFIGITPEFVEQDIRNNRRLIIIMNCIVLILGVGVFYLLVNRIVHPLLHLEQSAQKVAAGNYEVAVDINTKDEIESLGKVFNMMVQRIYEADRKIRHELEMAARIQLGMLPKKLPTIPGYEIAASLKMAKEAGGDLYDVIPLGNEEYVIVIGDVSGKGMPAALYMSAVVNVLRTAIGENVRNGAAISPAEVLKTVNRMMRRTMDSRNFVTIWVGILDAQTHELRYSSAGHDPAVAWNAADKQKRLLNTTGQACGFANEIMFERKVAEERTTIGAYEMIFWNTDGITEAMNMKKEEYTDTRYFAMIEGLRGTESAEVALTRLLADVQGFVKDAPQHDDMTLICLRRI